MGLVLLAPQQNYHPNENSKGNVQNIGQVNYEQWFDEYVCLLTTVV